MNRGPESEERQVHLKSWNNHLFISISIQTTPHTLNSCVRYIMFLWWTKISINYDFRIFGSRKGHLWYWGLGLILTNWLYFFAWWNITRPRHHTVCLNFNTILLFGNWKHCNKARGISLFFEFVIPNWWLLPGITRSEKIPNFQTNLNLAKLRPTVQLKIHTLRLVQNGQHFIDSSA